MIFKSRLGLGTNRLGLNPKNDLKSLNYALDIGYKVIDTAERYVDQASEILIGDCIKHRQGFERDSIQIITKVQPQNGVVDSCLGSLQRLQCDYVDCFLLHWRNNDSNLESIVEKMLDLQHKGYIKHYGVSNFSIVDLRDWHAAEHKVLGKSMTATNQIKYNFDVNNKELVLYHQQNNIATMAYMPLGKGDVLLNPLLIQYAEKLKLTPAQAALHWILQTPDTIAIPKSTNLNRLRENFEVLNFLD